MLKINLLPKHFAVARRNKALLVLFGLLLIGSVAGWLFRVTTINAQIVNYQAETKKLEPIVQEVNRLTQETTAKQAEIDPLKARVDFVSQADKTGEAWFKAFHAVTGYIWEKSSIDDFTIATPGSISFTAHVRGTVGAARFILNLMRCPALTSINVSGVPAGVSIVGMQGSGAATPGGMGGAPGMPPMPGGPGMPPMPGGPGMPPMPGAPGGMPGGPSVTITGTGAGAGSPDEEITLRVTAQLTAEYQINIPLPPGGAPAGGAGMGMGAPGMPGMPGAPGMAGPPGMPGAAGAPGGTPPPAVGGKAPKGGDEAADGPGKGKKDADAGEGA